MLGATALRASAARADGRPSRSRRAGRQLLKTLPSAALASARASGALEVLFEVAWHRRRTSSARAPGLRRTRRARWYAGRRPSPTGCWHVSETNRLAIAVDDVHEIDEPSAALLAVLASQARRPSPLRGGHRRDRGVARRRGGPRGPRERLDDDRAGAADPRADRGAPRLAVRRRPEPRGRQRGRSSRLGGQPARVHRPGEAPDRQGRDRYEGGGWTLPARLDPSNLPGTAEDAIRDRIAALQPLARWLAEAQALANDQFSPRGLSPRCVRTWSPAGIDRAISELVSNQVLVGDGRQLRRWRTAGGPRRSSGRLDPGGARAAPPGAGRHLRGEDADRRRASPARGRSAGTRPGSRRRAPQGAHRMPRTSRSDRRSRRARSLPRSRARSAPPRRCSVPCARSTISASAWRRSASARRTPFTGASRPTGSSSSKRDSGLLLWRELAGDEPGARLKTRARSGRAEVRGDAGARPRLPAGRSGPGAVPLRGDLDRDRLAVAERRAARDACPACSSRSRRCRPSSPSCCRTRSRPASPGAAPSWSRRTRVTSSFTSDSARSRAPSSRTSMSCATRSPSPSGRSRRAWASPRRPPGSSSSRRTSCSRSTRCSSGRSSRCRWATRRAPSVIAGRPSSWRCRRAFARCSRRPFPPSWRRTRSPGTSAASSRSRRASRRSPTTYPGWRPYAELAEGQFQQLRGNLDAARAAFERCIALTAPDPDGKPRCNRRLATGRRRAISRRWSVSGATRRRRRYGEQAPGHLPDPRHRRPVARYLSRAGPGRSQARRLRRGPSRGWTRSSRPSRRWASQGLILGRSYEARARIAIWAGDDAALTEYADLTAREYRHGRRLAARSALGAADGRGAAGVEARARAPRGLRAEPGCRRICDLDRQMVSDSLRSSSSPQERASADAEAPLRGPGRDRRLPVSRSADTGLTLAASQRERGAAGGSARVSRRVPRARALRERRRDRRVSSMTWAPAPARPHFRR